MVNNIKLTYIVASIALVLSSCSKGGEPNIDGPQNAIVFTPILGSAEQNRATKAGSGTEGTAREVNKDNLTKFNVTCFYPQGKIENGILAPYFENVTFKKARGGFDAVDESNAPISVWWPATKQSLKFLAYYPTDLSFSNQTKSIDNVAYKI